MEDYKNIKNLGKNKVLRLFNKDPKGVSKLVKIFTILTTCPASRSGNIGDRLITESCKHLIRSFFDERIYFFEFFREDDLTPFLDQVNATQAIVMPGFAIRESMHPRIYRLVPDLSKIKVPYIPMGSGEMTIPGVLSKILAKKYSDQTINFINHIVKNSKNGIGCRDPLVLEQLSSNGIKETTMIGDCAWYDLKYVKQDHGLNLRMEKIVFTEPHNSVFSDQVIKIINKIHYLFPHSIKIFSQHSRNIEKLGLYEKHASELGFKIRKCSHNIENIDFYDDCDFHIGYRVHGHISFLRRRKPSILFMEDSRGVGQGQALSYIGCETAFKEDSEGVVPRGDMPEILAKKVKDLQRTRFQEYYKAFDIIDKTYDDMRDFISKSL